MKEPAMIGLRHEDKSRWEARVPLVPDDVRTLIRDHGVRFCVERSPTRAFPADEYADAGAHVVDALDDCPIIMGVKEIPPEKLKPETVYVYFSHTIKGQPANMPALRRLLELGCTLIDYERITDADGRRLVAFGRYAGLAGMIDTLWALGLRLEHERIANPFTRIRPAHTYDDLAHVERELAAVAERIHAGGIPAPLRPLVVGLTGYGQVSQGAQHILHQLPIQEVTPGELAALPSLNDRLYVVVFREEHLVQPRDPARRFELQHYYAHPEEYAPAFAPQAHALHVLVNCIYWEPKYPRLLTQDDLRHIYAASSPRLRVVGDITCDVDGSLACTTRPTDPGNPVYVYDPQSGRTHDGVAGNGAVVLAVDFLPCELPVDASRTFSEQFRPFISALANADFTRPLEASGLPPELVRATICYRGALTEPYRYLAAHLDDAPSE